LTLHIDARCAELRHPLPQLLEMFREQAAPIFSSRQFGRFFKTHRGIISIKSELRDQGRRFVPELSPPFQMSSARVKTTGQLNKESPSNEISKVN
jgi:hypothetical protein